MPEDRCIFTVADVLAAIPARHVVEIVPAPELSGLPETPAYVVGAFNLRGRAVPVISLSARLLGELRAPRASDHVIVVEHAGELVGLLVTRVLDLAPVVEEDVEAPLVHAHASRAARFLKGLAKQGERIVALVDVERLVSLREEDPDTRLPRAVHDAVSVQEQTVLRDRAQRLAEVPAPERHDEREAAVVELGGELLALDPRRVREFARMREIAVVPDAPPHILGVVNLRGAVVTVVDLRPVLSLRATGVEPVLAAIVETGGGAICIAIERALDVVSVRSERRDADEDRHPHLSAATMPDGAPVSFLDLDGLLASGVLVVAEEANP